MCPWLLLARFSGSSQPFILDIYCRLSLILWGVHLPLGACGFCLGYSGGGRLGHTDIHVRGVSWCRGAGGHHLP